MPTPYDYKNWDKFSDEDLRYKLEPVARRILTTTQGFLSGIKTLDSASFDQVLNDYELMMHAYKHRRSVYDSLSEFMFMGRSGDNFIKNYRRVKQEAYRRIKLHNDYDPRLKKAARYVLNKCTQYLDEIDYEIDKYRLYRGINPNKKSSSDEFNNVKLAGDVVLLLNKRLERNPRDTDRECHDRINRKFEQEFGLPYRNGVFATGDDSEAMIYGGLYVIFPIGKYNYLWSTEISDFAGDIDHLCTISKNQFDKISFKKEFDYIENRGMKDAIASHNEIMIWCHSYIAINALYYDKFVDMVDSIIADEKMDLEQ